MGKIKEGALLVDVRRKADVESVTFDVPNYLNIPLEELEDRLHEIPKDQVIVMVSTDGKRSLKTTYFLMNHDYPNVFNMSGGLRKWVNKKFPTIGDVSGLFVISLTPPDCC